MPASVLVAIPSWTEVAGGVDRLTAVAANRPTALGQFVTPTPQAAHLIPRGKQPRHGDFFRRAFFCTLLSMLTQHEQHHVGVLIVAQTHIAYPESNLQRLLQGHLGFLVAPGGLAQGGTR